MRGIFLTLPWRGRVDANEMSGGVGWKSLVLNSAGLKHHPTPPSILLRATLGDPPPPGEGKKIYALAAFFRYARCTAQLQPGGCASISCDDTSLAGAADVGASVGIVAITARSCA